MGTSDGSLDQRSWSSGGRAVRRAEAKSLPPYFYYRRAPPGITSAWSNCPRAIAAPARTGRKAKTAQPTRCVEVAWWKANWITRHGSDGCLEGNGGQS